MTWVLLPSGTKNENSFTVRLLPEYLIGSVDLEAIAPDFYIYIPAFDSRPALPSIKVQYRNMVRKYSNREEQI